MGPTLIDCRLERGRDPIKGMEEYLRKRKLWSPEWKQQLVNDYTREFALVASSSK
jgi:TPP-dependent pyruvate/acetoin dehydrogenase alpha subunit